MVIYVCFTKYLLSTTGTYSYKHNNETNDYSWITFGSYVAIPSFYKKKGFLDTDKSLLSLATICGVDLLDATQHIILNYKSAPISIAVYIDADYRTHSNSSHTQLNKLFIKLFDDIINIKYDVTVGILYINTSSELWSKRKFLPSTPMTFKFPTNSLRNLAEYQVTTDWIFNIDIDFWYLSNAFNQNISSIINEINTYIVNPQYGEKSIFIVPSFEVLHENKDEYNTMDKMQLLDLIQNKQEIAPFHESMNAQICTKYNKWYEIERNYVIDHQYYNDNCSWAYEPWYIVKTQISRNALYQFNNSYIGRGLNKVERVFTLRHHCFNFIVMHNLFMIHSLSPHHEAASAKTTKKWHRYNYKLFLEERKTYYAVPGSCSFNYGYDVDCKTGKISKKTKDHCQICCDGACDQCIECDEHEMDSKCCVQPILQSESYCNVTMPPCKMTKSKYCPKKSWFF